MTTPIELRALLVVLGITALVTPSPTAGSSNSYRLGPQDQVSISVEELPELAEHHTISEDGSLNLKGFGNVIARGLTTDELALELAQELEAEGLRRATVTVAITEYRSRPITVLGAVLEPGNHFVAGRTSLLRTLVEAGGLATNHSGVVQIRRTAENGISDSIEIQTTDLLSRVDPRTDIPIFPGDLINVPESISITVHFLGEVGNPGSMTFPDSESVTLLTAISQAGGLTDSASNKIRIRRLVTGTERREIVCHFRRILNGEDDDIPLEDGDLVIVKQSCL